MTMMQGTTCATIHINGSRAHRSAGTSTIIMMIKIIRITITGPYQLSAARTVVAGPDWFPVSTKVLQARVSDWSAYLMTCGRHR